jgi:hypothetical protein
MGDSVKVLRTVYQSHDAGASHYEGLSKPGEATFPEVYHDVWFTLFTPAPAIATAIKRVLDEKGLVPYGYAGAHLRVLYTREDRKPGVLRKWTARGVDCASGLRPGKPIFLASDSGVVTEFGPLYGKDRGGIVVIHENNPNPPLHLDRAEMDRRPSDFYDTFTDLYLLALAGCIYFTKGGYGMWAIYIGGNLTCGFSQKAWKIKHHCPYLGKTNATANIIVENDPIFYEPMDSL